MATIDPGIARVREHAERRTIAASANGDAVATLLVAVATLALAWVASYAAGGSRSALPHAFYVPIVICAIRFGQGGALLVSLAAGIVAGPLLPLDAGLGTAQPLGNWLARLAAFVVIGQLTAFLSRYSMPSVTEEVAAHRFRKEFRNAIGDGQIRLEYQPIVDLMTGDVAGVEALARWDHPERGSISPEDFVSRAERYGCVNELTHHVVDQACRDVARWRTGPLAERNDFTLAVNVSAADIADPKLRQHISATLGATRLPNHWLHLEVTETALVDDVDLAVERLMDLRMLGIRLAIDDFGTGESSLGHLQRFPIDILKIDRLFVSHIDTDDPSNVVARGIVALAQAMQLSTVAEGIESPEQARIIRELGCTLGQGYLFSRPLNTNDLEGVLTVPHWFRYTNLLQLSAEPQAQRSDASSQEGEA